MAPAETDLHMHTVYSDGASEPEALLQALVDRGVKTVAVTDHDTVAAYERLIPAAAELGLELIPGIEINTYWHDTEVHVLGYFIDGQDDGLQAVMKEHRAHRRVQIKAMVERIRQMTNAPITVEDVLGRTHPDGSPGRPHIAKALMERKAVGTLSEAFSKYLNSKSGTYIKRPTVSPHEAVEAIYNSGGIPVIAHPGLAENIDKLVPELLAYGLGGMEAYHKSHSPAVIEYVCNMAEKHELLVTGGTDFHGLPAQYANSHQRLVMPLHILQRMKRLNAERKQAVFKVS
jgi:3',5'-nucleoside bisphosphate phosphatase